MRLAVLMRLSTTRGRDVLKSAEEIMNILDAYDLTGSFRDAAELAGCSHHTVERYVTAGENAGAPPERPERRDHRSVPGQGRGMGGPLEGEGPGGPGPRLRLWITCAHICLVRLAYDFNKKSEEIFAMAELG